MRASYQGRISGIVFDFDGTLAELHLDFAEMKHQLSRLYEDLLGDTPAAQPMPALEWIKDLAANLEVFDFSMARVFRERAHALIEHMELEAAYQGRLFDFTRPLLERLKAADVQTAIITRNCEKAVRVVFPDLEVYCNGFLSREHVPRVKPDPDHLFRALQQISVAPNFALMVGDHPIDILTGQLAGVMTAGVFSGNSSRDDLVQSGARWVARSCPELMVQLEKEILF